MGNTFTSISTEESVILCEWIGDTGLEKLEYSRSWLATEVVIVSDKHHTVSAKYIENSFKFSLQMIKIVQITFISFSVFIPEAIPP